MKIEDIKKNNELIGTALLAVSVLSAALIAAKVAGFFVISANAGSAVDRAIDRSKQDDKIVAAQMVNSGKIADALKKQNLFLPPAPKQHPVNGVLGILGDEALINGKWYKTGDKVADARIVAVEPTFVTIEWDGKEKLFYPIEGGESSEPSRPSRTKSVSSGKGGPQMIVTGSTAAEKPRSPDKSEAKKMKMIYDSMSESKKELFKKVMFKNKESYKHMSDAERARFKAGLIERIGGSKEIRGKQPVKLTSK